ncbi:OLC1v1004940C1 [Oldenlandia corymbosa var. corymbosa]|uniref:OLC1v1004940C1 n=1 Tax=Oldenlandia corymbosa var. corymbosa TaxID=529605 RepID=A0AAV1DG71_OLDCO|nr:OLC1v1004940C1 [Oldenlandia corymbosa var. corymbosa]
MKSSASTALSGIYSIQHGVAQPELNDDSQPMDLDSRSQAPLSSETKPLVLYDKDPTKAIQHGKSLQGSLRDEGDQRDNVENHHKLGPNCTKEHKKGPNQKLLEIKSWKDRLELIKRRNPCWRREMVLQVIPGDKEEKRRRFEAKLGAE